MKIVSFIANLLLIIGGLNWGLVGIAQFNLVSALFGGAAIERVIYILVGLSALWAASCYFKKCCGKESCCK